MPQGEGVIRHTSLPAEGRTPEWILGEMTKMDNEIGHAEWKQGKISGAVYRTHNLYISARVASLIISELHRRWRRSDEGHCRRVRALRGLQPTPSGCLPSGPEDGGRNRSNVPSDVQ